MCPKVKKLVLFTASRMSEKMSFKMGVKCAAPFYMGTNCLGAWHVVICKVPEVNYTISVKINRINKRY